MKFFAPPYTVKTVFSIALALLMLSMGLYFLMQEGVQFAQIRNTLVQADSRWLWFGIGLSVMYVWLHGEMYRQSFKAVGLQVSMRSMMRLYLKRNVLSVFLPAGFIASQTFFSSEVAQFEKIQERDVWSASGVFSVAALLSTVITVLPALGWMLTQHILPGGAAEAFLFVSVFLFALIWSISSFIRQGAVYHWCQRRLPALALRLNELDWSRFRVRYLLKATLMSCIVMALGIFHVFVAARTLGATVTLPMAFAGYVAVLIILMTAPFLRGVGTVEAVLSIVLIHFGLPSVEAVSAAILFRFFEFWLVLVFALPAFVFSPDVLPKRLVQIW